MEKLSFERNPGIPLDLSIVESVKVNKPAVIRRCQTHVQRRTVKKGHQLGWLLRICSLIDLTTLDGADSKSNVKRLCYKAKQPIRPDLLESLQIPIDNFHTAAICVYPNRIKDVLNSLKDTKIPVASVASGFPAGQTPMATRLQEIELAVSDGANEIDIVISRDLVMNADWKSLYDEVKQMREKCGDAHLKTILATGDFPSYRDIYKASLVCMMAGADFIKTSTGKESINAILPVGLVMMRAIRDYFELTGYRVGFKPAGGISSAKDAVSWLSLIFEELGEEWTHPCLFRIGASSLLLDVERQIQHGVTGQYTGLHYLAKA